ncbi:hypothetical protein [Nocardia brasiliensis]|uniref:hypothetical protein n=1 Tax=Nocardia brasiliensis TaxID=37326 RepID=UPI0024555942|nr:hypothetical protein [Nocardia brasiliensis]
MSWMLVRSVPRKLAGWQFPDSTTTPGALKQPFKHLGDGTPADINASLELHIPSNFSSTNGGGESYEFMPFTENSGLEVDIWHPVTGLAAQYFSVLLTNTWTNPSAPYANVVGVRFKHAPAAGGDTIEISQYSSPYSFSSALATFTSPVAFDGNVLNLKLWVDDDQFLRVWLNNTYLGAAIVESAFKLAPGKRGVRFFNNATNDTWIRRIFHYDRPGSFPASSVFNTEVLFDDYNRANGAVGNGWTQLGTNAGIVSNSWATTGTTDGSRAVIRDSGITNGRQRVEGVVGGAIGPSNSADSSLVLCSNSTGTVGLVANSFGNAVNISRFSTSLSGSSPTFTTLAPNPGGITISNGDLLAFNVYDGAAWLERNGVRILYAVNVNDVVPASNSWIGQRVERAPFSNSHSWNSCRIMAAA